MEQYSNKAFSQFWLWRKEILIATTAAMIALALAAALIFAPKLLQNILDYYAEVMISPVWLMRGDAHLVSRALPEIALFFAAFVLPSLVGLLGTFASLGAVKAHAALCLTLLLTRLFVGSLAWELVPIAPLIGLSLDLLLLRSRKDAADFAPRTFVPTFLASVLGVSLGVQGYWSSVGVAIAAEAEQTAGGRPFCILNASYKPVDSWLEMQGFSLWGGASNSHPLRFHSVLIVEIGNQRALHNWSYGSATWTRIDERSLARLAYPIPEAGCAPVPNFTDRLG